MSTERWLPVVGYEGHYEVSDLGRVRSLSRTIKKRRGQGPRIDELVDHRIPGYLLRPGTREQGRRYANVVLSGKNEVVHRLVLLAFRGPCPEGHEALHGDGDGFNNKLWNLRWGTQSENREDQRRHGTLGVGEKHGRAILNEQQVIEIRASKRRVARLARQYGVSTSTIRAVQRQDNWKHVGEQPCPS